MARSTTAKRARPAKAKGKAKAKPAAAKSTRKPPATTAVADGFLGTYRSGRAGGSVAAQIAAVTAALFDHDGSDRRHDDLPETGVEWSQWAIAPGALVFAAQAYGVPAEGRREARSLLELLLETPLLRSTSKLRLWVGTGLVEKVAAVVWRGGNGYFVRRRSRRGIGDELLVLEHAPSGVWKPLPGATIRTERKAIPIDEDAVRGFLARLARGVPAWSAEAVAAIAAGTGLTTGEAALAWAGFPRLFDPSPGFLPEDLREGMGLTARAAAAARDRLRTIELGRRLEVLAAAASAPPALWDPIAGAAAERLVGAWNRVVGRRTRIPDGLVDAAEHDVVAPMPADRALAMIASPKSAPTLITDGAWGFDPVGTLVRTESGTLIVPVAPAPEPDDDGGDDGLAQFGTGTPACDLATLHTAAVYLPYLFAALPVGDPLRAQLPVVYRLVQDRLSNPDLWLLQATNVHRGDDASAIAAALAAFGGDALPAPVVGRIGKGAAMVQHGHQLSLYLRPSELVTPSDLARVRVHTAHDQRAGVGTRDVIAYLRSDELRRMIDRVVATPVPAGGWEQNPLASAAELVARLKQRLGVSAEAAALYLQMLTLLWPTPSNIQTWNGWTAGVYRQVIAELVDHDLVVEARRARAQRNHVLPGGWEALASPHPPMEAWKVPLYADERTEAGDPRPRFDRFVAYDAPHVLYELAWARIEAGDPPG